MYNSLVVTVRAGLAGFLSFPLSVHSDDSKSRLLPPGLMQDLSNYHNVLAQQFPSHWQS